MLLRVLLHHAVSFQNPPLGLEFGSIGSPDFGQAAHGVRVPGDDVAGVDGDVGAGEDGVLGCFAALAGDVGCGLRERMSASEH